MKRTEKNGFFPPLAKADEPQTRDIEESIAELFYQYIPEQTCSAFAKDNLIPAITACAQDWTLTRIAIEALCSHKFLNHLSTQNKEARNAILDQLNQVKVKPSGDYCVDSALKSFTMGISMKFVMNKPETESGWSEKQTTKIASELKQQILKLINTPSGMNKLILDSQKDLQGKGVKCTVSLSPSKIEINLFELQLAQELERALKI